MDNEFNRQLNSIRMVFQNNVLKLLQQTIDRRESNENIQTAFIRLNPNSHAFKHLNTSDKNRLLKVIAQTCYNLTSVAQVDRSAYNHYDQQFAFDWISVFAVAPRDIFEIYVRLWNLSQEKFEILLDSILESEENVVMKKIKVQFVLSHMRNSLTDVSIINTAIQIQSIPIFDMIVSRFVRSPQIYDDILHSSIAYNFIYGVQYVISNYNIPPIIYRSALYECIYHGENNQITNLLLNLDKPLPPDEQLLKALVTIDNKDPMLLFIRKGLDVHAGADMASRLEVTPEIQQLLTRMGVTREIRDMIDSYGDSEEKANAIVDRIRTRQLSPYSYLFYCFENAPPVANLIYNELIEPSEMQVQIGKKLLMRYIVYDQIPKINTLLQIGIRPEQPFASVIQESIRENEELRSVLRYYGLLPNENIPSREIVQQAQAMQDEEDKREIKEEDKCHNLTDSYLSPISQIDENVQIIYDEGKVYCYTNDELDHILTTQSEYIQLPWCFKTVKVNPFTRARKTKIVNQQVVPYE